MFWVTCYVLAKSKTKDGLDLDGESFGVYPLTQVLKTLVSYKCVYQLLCLSESQSSSSVKWGYPHGLLEQLGESVGGPMESTHRHRGSAP